LYKLNCMEQTIKKEKKKSEPKYFTDEDAKNVFVFQEPYKTSVKGKPIQKSISLKFRKR